MLQILQNGLHSTKASIADNLIEKNQDEQFSSSFDDFFQSSTIEEKQKTEKTEVSVTTNNEEIETDEFSDVMQVSEDTDSENAETIHGAVAVSKKDNKEEKTVVAEEVNSNIKGFDKDEKLFDKTELLALLSKNQEKKSNTKLEVNLERLPKDFSIKIKNLIANKSDNKKNIEQLSHDVGSLLLSQFQMKEKNTGKKVTSETFVKNVSEVALKDGKLILKGSENLKQLKITGKADLNSNKGNQLSVGLKELLFTGKEQFTKTEKLDSQSNNKIEVLSDAAKAKKSRFEKIAVNTEKDKAQKNSSIQTKDVFEIKNEIKENFSMPINNKQVSSEELTRSFQEQKTALYEQVTKQTKVLLTSDKVSFSTFIRPEEIGRVDFKFVTKDGKVNGKIILQNQEAADLFRASVEDLRAVFQRSNVELDKLEIQIAGRQNFETGDFDFSGNSNNTGDRNAQSQEKTATVGLHQAVKAFDEGAVAIEKNIYSGNGIHLVI